MKSITRDQSSVRNKKRKKSVMDDVTQSDTGAVLYDEKAEFQLCTSALDGGLFVVVFVKFVILQTCATANVDLT